MGSARLFLSLVVLTLAFLVSEFNGAILSHGEGTETDGKPPIIVKREEKPPIIVKGEEKPPIIVKAEEKPPIIVKRENRPAGSIL